MYEVKDKVVLVTGAAAGVGAEVVIAFVKEGAKHVAILDVDVNSGTELASKLNLTYGANRVQFIKCDVTTDDLTFAYDKVLKEFEYIDIVVNNAGIMNDEPNVYKKEIAINVTALITSTLKAFEIMRKDRGGKGGAIINIASILALQRTPLLPIYSATKIAVLHFSGSLGADFYYTRTGVRVIPVCFSATGTALLTRQKTGSIDDGISAELMERLNSLYKQKPESAAAGVLAAYKHGASASTWVAADDKEPEDISERVNKAYEMMIADLIDS